MLTLLCIIVFVVSFSTSNGFSLTLRSHHISWGRRGVLHASWHSPLGSSTREQLGKPRNRRWPRWRTSSLKALPEKDTEDLSSIVGATNATALALEFKRRAQQLKAEARNLELTLEIKKVKKAQQTSTELYTWVKELFIDNRRPLNAEVVANTIREQRYSEQQVLKLVDALYEQQAALTRQAAGVPSTVNDDLVNSGITNSTSLAFIQLLLEASSIVDNDPARNEQRWSGRVKSKLMTRLNELNLREESELKRQSAISAVFENRTSAGADKESTRSGNEKRMKKANSYRVPYWLPGALAMHINSTKPMPLNKTDIQTIQDVILTRTGFFCTAVETIPHAAVFRGNIRLPTSPVATQKATTVKTDISSTLFTEIQQEMVKEGLADRIRLFFLNDPVRRQPKKSPTQSNAIVVAIPKQQVYQPTTTSSLSVAACFMTAFSLVAYSIKSYALNPRFYESIVFQHDDSAIPSCLPVAFGALLVQTVHEVAHRLAARKHKLKLSWPIPIPSLKYGIIGWITKLRSFPSDRRAVFDFAMSGPIASFSFSILLMVIGCHWTVNSPLDALQRYPYVLPGQIRSSYFATSVVTQCLSRVMNIPLSQPVPLHPIFIAGWTGLIVSALNLLPIFQLDGGRGLSAVMGNRIAAIATSWTLLSCISLGPFTGLWAVVTVLLNCKSDLPALDEVSPLPRWRVVAWYVTMAIASMTLLPHPGKLLRL